MTAPHPHASARAGSGGPRRSRSARELFSQSEELADDVRDLAGSVRALARGWQDLVRGELERRPYATLAAAAGAGYVLGGGLPTTVVRVLIGIGGRLALERALRQFAVAPPGGEPATETRRSS